MGLRYTTQLKDRENFDLPQTPATKAKDTDPTAAGINVKAVYYLPICLLAVIQIMS